MAGFKNIAAERKRNGINQEQLGAAVGVSSKTVSNWEIGQSVPDARVAKRVCDYFGMTFEYLFAE